MKILHCPTNPANQATVVARFQKRMGLDPRIVVFKDSHGFGSDLNLNCSSASPSCLVKTLQALRKEASPADVIHYYYDTFLKTKYFNNLDMKHLAPFKTIMFQFCGCDARLGCKICAKPLCNQAENRKRINNAIKYADHIIYPIPELIKNRGEWVPYAIDLEEHKPGPDPENAKITILHVPTDSGIKGTQAITREVLSNHNVNYIHLTNVPYNKMKEYYAKADIIVDQLYTEWYGTMAAEVMAMGKPVLSPIAPELESYADKCPVVRVTEKNLGEQLRVLIKDEDLRKELGDQGRKYAERVHDAKKITERIVKLYE